MQWSDEAIILSARKFGETGLLVEVFAKTKGLYSGMVRGGQSKTKLNIFQPGNIVVAEWRSRLEEQLGSFSAEMVDAVSAKVIHDSKRLLGLLSLSSLLRKTLIDRNPYDDLYECMREYLLRLHQSQEWLEEYVWAEMAILRYLGFGLDLSTCAVTGNPDGLKFISPKTGRAVTAEGAKGYEDKLFSLPGLLKDGVVDNGRDVLTALEITGYFLEKSLFAPHNRKLPDERGRFVRHLVKTAEKVA